MKLKRFYQDGGAAGGEDVMQQILQMAAQAVKNNDGDLALQVCAALVQLAGGGAGAGAGEGAGAEEEPVYGKGGRIVGSFRRR